MRAVAESDSGVEWMGGTEDVLPPYMTAITPNVARQTAASRLGSHFRLKSLTDMRYAKKAFVFHIAVTSLTLRCVNQFPFHDGPLRTHDAREIAANQSREGNVIPTVNAKTSKVNLRRGKGVPGPERCSEMAIRRLLKSVRDVQSVLANR
jgi:hypothetical protein